MAKILITGGKGQLGRAIAESAAANPRHTIRSVDLDELDITDSAAVMRMVSDEQPDFVVNCAAYTAVDKAEEEVEKAFAINDTGVKNLAAAVAKQNARMIHISTDYVFDGQGCTPYPVDHRASPLSIYGQSKLAGEVAAIYDAPGTIIIRTSWLYHHGGNNFVNTIIKNATVKKQLQVVCDQIGSPTRASDLAGAILHIIGSPLTEKESRVYHFANSGVASWYDFAKAIVTILNIPCTIEPIPTTQLNLAAPRPSYSVMDCSLIQQHYGLVPLWWQDALKEYLTKQLNI